MKLKIIFAAAIICQTNFVFSAPVKVTNYICSVQGEVYFTEGLGKTTKMLIPSTTVPVFVSENPTNQFLAVGMKGDFNDGLLLSTGYSNSPSKGLTGVNGTSATEYVLETKDASTSDMTITNKVRLAKVSGGLEWTEVQMAYGGKAISKFLTGICKKK